MVQSVAVALSQRCQRLAPYHIQMASGRRDSARIGQGQVAVNRNRCRPAYRGYPADGDAELIARPDDVLRRIDGAFERYQAALEGGVHGALLELEQRVGPRRIEQARTTHAILGLDDAAQRSPQKQAYQEQTPGAHRLTYGCCSHRWREQRDSVVLKSEILLSKFEFLCR